MIRIETVRLVQLLGDLAHTAAFGSGAASEGILLNSARGYLGEDVGVTDLLVGTSTSGVAIGHTYVQAYGLMEHPMLWPLTDVRAVIAAFKPKATSHKDHAVEIRRDLNEIRVCEDPDLFGDGLALRFTEGPAAKFPRVFTALETPPVVDEDTPSLPRHDYTAARLAPFLKVARSRGEAVQLYRYHHTRRALVQIGPHYRGVITPFGGWNDQPNEGAEPSAEVHAAALPVEHGE
ncbi:hypothetical protein [Prauserella cavernicola]|uniref:Uncharacterized protein n=1 Tax=Prauserella cavernicola TaxID=2800127 RepID=A0A934QRP4_9PSEU|nr:hypothetical protein [Prauserella cavernicola]MBK1785115.1 hypothetical protein [Prauserella cavernicola]